MLQWRRDVGDESYLNGLSELVWRTGQGGNDSLLHNAGVRALRARMAAMIVERATHPQFLSNTYLVADQTVARRSSSTPAGPWPR